MNASPGVERRSIDVVPAHERHGSPANQFTLWFGANMQITALVDGALAVVFGADALWAIVGLTLGNILGGIVPGRVRPQPRSSGVLYVASRHRRPSGLPTGDVTQPSSRQAY